MTTLFATRWRILIIFLFLLSAMAGWCFQVEKAVSIASDLRLREGPSIGDDVLNSLINGQSVWVVRKSSFSSTIDGRNSPWFLVVGLDGKKEGWAFGGYLTISSKKEFSLLDSVEKNIWLRAMARDIFLDKAPDPKERIYIRKELNSKFSFAPVFFPDLGYGQPPIDMDNDGTDDFTFKLKPEKRDFSMVLFMTENQALALLAEYDYYGMSSSDVESIEAVDFNHDNKFELMLTEQRGHDSGGESVASFFRSTSTGGPYTRAGRVKLDFGDHYAFDDGSAKCESAKVLERNIANADEDPDLELIYKVEENCYHDPRDPNKFPFAKLTVERIIDLSNNAFNITEKILSISKY